MLDPLRQEYAHLAPPELLAGLAGPDDAAVYKLDDQRALIMTTDFFPPILDDPYVYGAVAASNALSDVYAMGGEPILAINLVGWPNEVESSVLASILRGGADKVAESGAFLAGGHTVVDSEPKYGLAVAGLVKPDETLRKGGAVPGDVIVLTKPLGSGTITTALKNGKASDVHVEACASVMAALNRDAKRAAQAVNPRVHGATDVSGFGLLGHAHEMATESGCALTFEWDQVPWMQGAMEYARAEQFSGGAERNSEFFGEWVRFKLDVDNWQRMLLFDPQTSGGLLLAVAADSVSRFLLELQNRDQIGYIVGEAIAGRGGDIIVC